MILQENQPCPCLIPTGAEVGGDLGTAQRDLPWVRSHVVLYAWNQHIQEQPAPMNEQDHGGEKGTAVGGASKDDFLGGGTGKDKSVGVRSKGCSTSRPGTPETTILPHPRRSSAQAFLRPRA